MSGAQTQTGLTPERAALILELRVSGRTWGEIAEAVGVNRLTLWDWRKKDLEFSKKCDAASDRGVDRIEDAMQAAASKVADDPRYTTAAIFSLKNRRPERWRDVQKVEHSGRVQLEHMSEDELRRMAHTLDEDKGE